MKLQRQLSGGTPLWTKTCSHDLEEALPVERRQSQPMPCRTRQRGPQPISTHTARPPQVRRGIRDAAQNRLAIVSPSFQEIQNSREVPVGMKTRHVDDPGGWTVRRRHTEHGLLEKPGQADAGPGLDQRAPTGASLKFAQKPVQGVVSSSHRTGSEPGKAVYPRRRRECCCEFRSQRHSVGIAPSGDFLYEFVQDGRPRGVLVQPRGKLLQNHSQGIQIDTPIQDPTPPQLRRQVGRRPAQFLSFEVRKPIDGETEVEQPDGETICFLKHEDVLGFQIGMDPADAVNTNQTLAYRLRQMGDPRHGNIRNRLLKRSPCQVLEHEDKTAGSMPHQVQETRRNAGGEGEQAECFTPEQREWSCLEDHLAVRQRVQGQTDLPVIASMERPDFGVANVR
jgi:hypothetical protein